MSGVTINRTKVQITNRSNQATVYYQMSWNLNNSYILERRMTYVSGFADTNCVLLIFDENLQIKLVLIKNIICKSSLLKQLNQIWLSLAGNFQIVSDSPASHQDGCHCEKWFFSPCSGVSKFFYNRRYFLNFRRYLKN